MKVAVIDRERKRPTKKSEKIWEKYISIILKFLYNH